MYRNDIAFLCNDARSNYLSFSRNEREILVFSRILLIVEPITLFREQSFSAYRSVHKQSSPVCTFAPLESIIR